MTDNANSWQFKRGLDEDFMQQLEPLARQAGWFADVLGDPDLILGIRDNYLNVYRLGQSLFKIERQGKTGPLEFSTHPKYLVDPELSKPVRFDGNTFGIGSLKPLIKEYDKETTLNRMKRAAKLYCGDEKIGVHSLAIANENVVDTEVAFNNLEADSEDEPNVPRIDLACLEEVPGSIRLRFWEAKLYTNPELRAAGDTEAPVVQQVRGYRKLVGKHGAEMLESYRRVASNLVDIARWVPGRKVGKLIESVAQTNVLSLDNPPLVGLTFYGYDSAQKGSARWNRDIEKLQSDKLMPVRFAGDPKKIRLTAGTLDEEYARI